MNPSKGVKAFLESHKVALGTAMYRWRCMQGKPRKPLGMREASKHAGISCATWSRMERGDRRSSAESLMRMYALLALEEWAAITSAIARSGR